MSSQELLPELLNEENFKNGFLIDEELMAGVSEEKERPGEFSAFVLSHVTGEYVGYQVFSDLSTALSSINSIPRAWIFESSSGCGSGNCGAEGGELGEGCGKGACRQSCQTTGTCEITS